MSLCEKCDKPVYFAERKTSLGKDWHRECLRCAECGKVLHPGQHAQHKGTPYCHVPCYSALFGPTMFGHGSAVEAHTNFGMQAAKMSSPVRKPDLQVRLKQYNEHYDAANLQIRSKEVNGRLLLEGPLRIHWGVRKPIQLAEKDESPASRDEWRRSYCLAMANGLDDDFLQRLEKSRASGFTKSAEKLNDGGETMRPLRREIDEIPVDVDAAEVSNSAPGSPSKSKLHKSGTVVIRGNSGKRRSRRKRLSIINGHIFNVDTSVFTPAYGSLTNVTVLSLDTVYDVIRQLLDKFKIENNPREFCLCVVKGSGETRVLKEQDCPLLQRVLLGPLEDNAKIFIMDDGNVTDIDEDVAHFVNLPDAMLQGFLLKLQIEEQRELKLLKERYRRQQYVLEDRLSEFSSTHL